MSVIAKGTRLYRGIDCPPEGLSDPLTLNSFEKVLWLAPNSAVAQTYIPESGGRIVFKAPDRPALSNYREPVRPDEGVVDAMLREMGIEVQIHRREWPAANGPKDLDPRFVTNGTIGRPMSWSWRGGEPTWEMIFARLKELGYKDADYGKLLDLKTRHEEGQSKIIPARSRLRGSLVIYRATEDIQGENRSGRGDLLDPDYHHAEKWAGQANEAGLGFIEIGDYCQTKTWGNVGHASFAFNERGVRGLEIEAVIPARHFEWSEETGPWGKETPEERAWRRGLIRSAPIRAIEASVLEPITPEQLKAPSPVVESAAPSV